MRRASINQAEAATTLIYLFLTQEKLESTAEVCRAVRKRGGAGEKWRRKQRRRQTVKFERGGRRTNTRLNGIRCELQRVQQTNERIEQ